MYITKFESLDETLVAALQRDIDEYAPGIKIIAIRVTKPRIPKSIKENYEAISEAVLKDHAGPKIRSFFELDMGRVAQNALDNIDTWAAPHSNVRSDALFEI